MCYTAAMSAIPATLFLSALAFAALGDASPGIGPYATAVEIPISIRNELDVVLESGREYLGSRQGEDGLWDIGAAERSSLPAFAFLEPPQFGIEPTAALRKAVSSAMGRLARSAPFVQPREMLLAMAEDALVVAASLSVFPSASVLPADADVAVLHAVRTRLAAVDWGTESWTAAWLYRTVLDLVPGPGGAGETKAWRQGAADGVPAVRDVALSGLEQLRRGPQGEPAVRAHLRWIGVHTDLFREGAPASTPEDLYYLSAFLDSASPAQAAEAGIPASWRTMVAQRLIATARSAGTGVRWEGGNDVRQTLFAVATLVTL